MSAEDYMFESGDWADWAYTYDGYHRRRYKQYGNFDYSFSRRSYTTSERKAYGYRKVRAFYKEFLKALPLA